MMSMWEIEALMENTVRLIDKGEFEPKEKRNLIWNAYKLQNQFDCSFTHFRLMDVLIKNEYVQQFGIDDFPLSKMYPDFFFELKDKRFGWVVKNPNEKRSESNQEVAYWEKRSGKIFVDFGSEFYTQNKSESPEEIEPLRFGCMMIKEGGRQGNKSIVYDWTAFLVNYLLSWIPSDKSAQQLKDEYFSEIKSVFCQFDFSDYEVLHEGLDMNDISEDVLEEMSEEQEELIRYLHDK